MRSSVVIVAAWLLVIGGRASANEELCLAFDRTRPKAEIRLGEGTTFRLAADRDIARLSIEVRAEAGASDAGDWRVTLTPLATSTDAGVELQGGGAQGSKPVWNVRRRITADRPADTEVVAQVPRNHFRNWRLSLARSSPGSNIILIISAVPIDEAVRARQLMFLRSQYNPETDHAAVRELVGVLTDDEVRHWTGFRSRAVFQTVWRRLNLDQIMARFGDDAPNLIRPAHPLPNGLELHVLRPPSPRM